MTTLLGITSVLFLVKVLTLTKIPKQNRVIDWMKQDNDKSSIDCFAI